MSISWETILGAKTVVDKQNQEELLLNLGLPLPEFEKRDLAVEVYSDILQSIIWLCSNDSMVRQIQQDNPGSVCYTAQELKKLIKMNPGPHDLKSIHDAKKAFPGSTIIKTKTKEELLDQYLCEMDKEFCPDLYTWIDENDEELSTRITEAEEEINKLYKSGSVEDLKSALVEYEKLHGEAFNKMTKEKNKSKSKNLFTEVLNV